MKCYHSYQEAEDALIEDIIRHPQYITKTTYERWFTGFILKDPFNNRNNHSNYDYAEKFFEWILSGEKKLSKELLELNPWVKRFVDSSGLPDNFSASYGWKIKEQFDTVMKELKRDLETRRAFVNILYPADQVILDVRTTHEYPCTIGLQFFIRDEQLHMSVNMRSNNVYSVMPYDVYNFTSLLIYTADRLLIPVGKYYHQINNAHLYKGDVRRIQENKFIKT